VVKNDHVKSSIGVTTDKKPAGMQQKIMSIWSCNPLVRHAILLSMHLGNKVTPLGDIT
jgi:hypothetical protein